MRSLHWYNSCKRKAFFYARVKSLTKCKDMLNPKRKAGHHNRIWITHHQQLQLWILQHGWHLARVLQTKIVLSTEKNATWMQGWPCRIFVRSILSTRLFFQLVVDENPNLIQQLKYLLLQGKHFLAVQLRKL